MKIEIELTDTEAALLWADRWKELSVRECVQRAVDDAVSKAAGLYRNAAALESLLAEFRAKLAKPA